jgi:hypothetical protein
VVVVVEQVEQTQQVAALVVAEPVQTEIQTVVTAKKTPAAVVVVGRGNQQADQVALVDQVL